MEIFLNKNDNLKLNNKGFWFVYFLLKKYETF